MIHINDFKTRTSLLLGEDAMDKLSSSSVMVIGLGGVGGAVCEGLVRSGIGKIIVADHDIIDITNINRQIFATHNNIGMKKTLVAKERLLSINPSLEIIALDKFYNAETAEDFLSYQPNYIVDAIDTVTSKLHLAVECQNKNIPLIMSLGTGNRIDPTKFKIGNISDTSGCGCGLARVMRHELKARGITKLDVIYSIEIPRQVIASSENGRHSPASISFCPPVAGYIIASHVIKKITE